MAVIGRANIYKDDDETTVITFVTEASGAVRDLSLRAGFLIDLYTSASVDVVTNATPGTKPDYFEARAEPSLGASYRLGGVTLSGGYIYSIEHDYRSHTVSIGSSIELFDRTSTLSIGYRLGFDEIWRGGVQRYLDGRSTSGRAAADPFFAARDKTRHGLDLSWTQVLGQRTLGVISYGLGLESGFLSSPYRFVSTVGGTFRTREIHPDSRVRHALGFRIRRYLFRDAAIEGMYRFYGDGWGVFSHTTGATFLFQPFKWLELEAHDRLYWQTDADFYRPSYAGPEEFMSGDKELSRFWDNMIGVRAGLLFGPFRVLDRLRLDARFDWIRFWYSNFPLRPQLNAYITQLGLGGDF